MNKFFRNSLMAGVLAFGLAACGDDITVSEPPAPPAVPNITSFSVAPAAVTLTAGQEVQSSYNLALAPGLTGTVAYLSSASTVASVDANGKITAAAPGTALITVTATSAGQSASATIGVTVLAAPVINAITSFTVAPTTASMVAGTTTQASYNLQLAQGLSGAVSWASSATSIATVNPATGMITAVAPGTAVITATATSAGQTASATIGVTVTAVVPASVSIHSVTDSLLTIPVNASNVNGQIEINLNFNPGGQQIDSIVTYIGSKRAAKQAYSVGATPAAGLISMSVNTANYTKDAVAGTTTVDFNNGPTTINAIVFPRATVGQSAGNCANAPTGVASVCSSNTFSIVLNNMDGWAADMAKPTRSATGIAGSAAVGQTFWGGPGADGTTTATLYPVIYTAGRSVSTVTWGIMGCPTVVQTTLPFTRSWATAAATGTSSCAGYEWLGGARNNVMVASAIDNAANAFAAFAGLIPNTVVFNSTPDSMRVDYKGPSAVSTPAVAGAKGFFWVNAAWPFNPGGTTVTDAGVSALSSTWTAYLASGYTTAVTTGADLAESNTNVFATDGYRLRATGMDLLTNPSNSAVSADFGVDFVAPMIRYSLIADFAPIYVSGGTTLVADSTTRAAFGGQYGVNVATVGSMETYLAAAAGTNDQVRTEAIDNRSGLSNSITTVRRFAQGGATGATSTVASFPAGAFGVALVDGWRPAPAQHVTAGSSVAGYYTTTQQAVDRAGNTSSSYKRTLALDTLPPAVTGVSPNASYTANAAASFTIGAQDDLEVIDARLRIHYGNVTDGAAAPTASDGLIWNYGTNAAFATRFDNSIINPLLGTLTLDMYTASVQETYVVNAALPYSGDPIPTGVVTVVKPDSVAAQVRDVFGSFSANFTAGANTGVSTELASPLLSATLPAVGTYSVTYDASANCPAGGVVGGPCVIGGINFRTFGAQTATTKTFRATQSLSTTLPIFTRVDLFGLNAAGEWVFIQRITVPASISTSGTVAAGAGTITGSDNGFERYWTYAFTAIPANTYTQYRALGVNASGFGLFSVRN